MPSGRAIRSQIHGVDFSGAAKAGRKIWIASGTVADGVLAIDTCRRAADLPGSSADREAALTALCNFIAERPADAFGLDFPFSLPRDVIAEPSWEEFLRRFPDRYPDAKAFCRRCHEATGGKEARRLTDYDAHTPFSPYNLRLYRQTYYGIRDVLRPLVLGRLACVLPMQPVQHHSAWLIEICPASTLKAFARQSRLDLSAPYKGNTAAHRAARQRILTALEQTQHLAIPDQALRCEIGRDPEGDALDSLIAAFATFRATRRPAFPSPDWQQVAKLEGYVYI